MYSARGLTDRMSHEMYANLNKATYAPSPTWESAIIAAYNLGIITVVAAGNNDVRCPL
jgi:hypothetical protein